MAHEITIPALPCQSINDIITFYVALGFEITYHQPTGHTYAVVQREDFVLHFFAMKALAPQDNYSTCIVLVPDAEALRNAFVSGVRQHYGKLPVAGFPRIMPMRKKADGGRGFNVIDPGGNWIRITQHGGAAEATEDTETEQAALTRLTRAIKAAEFAAESKGDLAAGAKVLDVALARDEPYAAIDRFRALVTRAWLALEMSDPERAATVLAEARQLTLTADERSALEDDLERAHDLEQMIV